MRLQTLVAVGLAATSLAGAGLLADTQVDQARAAVYFQEAAALCAREGGRLWGVSLCGPMVFADPATHTIATNQPAPDAARPPALGFANAAMAWGDTRWSTFVWAYIPADQHARGRLMLHELFHRIQPQLGLLVAEGRNDHLDTLDGRYWLQLEWRALARTLAQSGTERTAALRDAVEFRRTRRAMFAGSAETERVLEINEGLAQYTGTVASVSSRADAIADTIDQLAKAPQNTTFVRTFAYASGAAYGMLLDELSPMWRGRVTSTSDLGDLVMSSTGIQPAGDVTVAATRYGGPALRVAEEARDRERQGHIAELRRRFVDGPVLVLPGAPSASFTNTGMTPVPGAGTIYPSMRATAEWGSLVAATALMAPDRRTLTVPMPFRIDGSTLTGDGWTLKVAPGWVVRPGERSGDFRLVREK